MSRPRLPIGAYGTILFTQRGKQWVARTRYHDPDGVARLVERMAVSKEAARVELLKALTDRAAAAEAAAAEEEMQEDAELTSQSTVAELAAAWLVEVEESDRSAGTRADYHRLVKTYIVPGLGSKPLSKATTRRLDTFLKNLKKENGHGTARQARTVLNMMFGLAVRWDALPTNPVRETTTFANAKPDPQVLPIEEVRLLLARLLDWDAAIDRRGKPGRPRISDLADPALFLAGTGCRTGEVFALRWEDVDLSVTPARVNIVATVISLKGGLVRQPFTKSHSGMRNLPVDQNLVAMLQRRKGETLTQTVFASSTGTVRSTANFRTQWRAFRAHYGYEDWVTPKVLRRVVATTIRDSSSIENAAEQLGHSTSAVTKRHYAARVRAVSDFTGALERITTPQSIKNPSQSAEAETQQAGGVQDEPDDEKVA